MGGLLAEKGTELGGPCSDHLDGWVWELRDGDLRKAGVTVTGYRTRWVRPEETADDPERIAIREALAFGKALYDIRTELSLSVAELAARAEMTGDDIERVEEGGTEPAVPLLRRLAAALNSSASRHAGARRPGSDTTFGEIPGFADAVFGRTPGNS